MKKNKKLIFFDICNTLGKTQTIEDIIEKEKKYSYDKFTEKVKMKIRKRNYLHIEEESISALHKLMTETNASLVCVSSWISGLKKKEITEKMFVEMLNELFSERFPKWNKKTEIQLLNIGSSERCLTIKNHVKKTKFKGSYVVIDDATMFSNNKEHGLEFDGRNGFVEKDISKAKLILNKEVNYDYKFNKRIY